MLSVNFNSVLLLSNNLTSRDASKLNNEKYLFILLGLARPSQVPFGAALRFTYLHQKNPRRNLWLGFDLQHYCFSL